jgi:hypothetical protein
MMAFAAAEKSMGVPQLLDKNDFSLHGKHDEKSIILYVAKLKQGCDLLHTYRARLARSLDEQRPRVHEGAAASVMLTEPSPQDSALQWLQHQPQSPLDSPDRDGLQSSTVFPNPPQSTPPGDGLVHPISKDLNPILKDLNPISKDLNPISKERAAAVLSWAQGLLDDKEARIAYAKEVFAEADADGSGSMEITEAIASVHEMARAVDLKLPSPDEIRKLLDIGHMRRDGSLHVDEFLTFFKAMLESALNHSKVSTPKDESALNHSIRRVLPATPDPAAPAAPTARPEKKSSVVEAKAKTDFFFKRSWKEDVNTAKSPARSPAVGGGKVSGKLDLYGEVEGGYEQTRGYDETGRGDEGAESKMSPDSLHTWALAAIDASDDDLNPDIPSFPKDLALAFAARIEERVDAKPAPDSPYDPELDPDNREARPATSPAMRQARLSREHEHEHTTTWKKRPATPPRLARDAAKTASDAAMASLSATTAEAEALAALDSAKNAATAAEAARGAAYAAAAATTAQEALIQAQAAEAEALKARDLASQLGDDDLTIFIAALATASSHARDAAGAANSAVAAAAAAHEAAEAAAARETALAAAKARLKALRLELAAEAAALSSLEKAASESSYETALEARLREIESPRRPPSNLVIAEALAAATKDLVRVTSERDRARAEADAAALALTTVLPPDTLSADVLRRLARRLHHHKGARYGAGETSEERSALNAWQRRVLSWQRSVLGSEATSPCTSPPSSPSKLPVHEAEPEVVLRMAPPRSAPPVAPIPAAPMPQVAASTSQAEGAWSLVLVDGPPVELRDRLPPPAPPAALGLLATLTKLVPRLSVAMIVWFVMIILLELLSRVYMAFADPTAAVGIVGVAPKLRMVESELFARALQRRFVGWWKVHMAQMPDQLQLGAAAAGQLLAIHKDLLVIQLRATSASIAHWAKERSKRHLGRVESAWRHAIDVAPSPTHCKLPHVMMHWYSVEVLRKKGCTAPVFQWDVSY